MEPVNLLVTLRQGDNLRTKEANARMLREPNNSSSTITVRMMLRNALRKSTDPSFLLLQAEACKIRLKIMDSRSGRLLDRKSVFTHANNSRQTRTRLSR